MTTFTARREDLSTIRFAWSPAWETHLAVRMLIHPEGRGYHRSWHATVLSQTARIDLAALFAVNPHPGSVPDFLTPRLASQRRDSPTSWPRSVPPRPARWRKS